MGIYSEYGIEYGGYESNGNYITLLPIKLFDERLIHSNYYSQREKFYQENYGLSWCIKIENIDIELRDLEKELVQKTSLRDLGFYDVSRVHTTL